MVAPLSEPANNAFFSGQRDRADGAFDGVVVELDAAIIDEARQPLPARERITDGVCKLALLTDQTEFCTQPLCKCLGKRPAFCWRVSRRSSALRPRMSFSTA